MDPRQFQHMVVNDNDIHSIVMSYLLHNCFDETAATLASTAGIKQPPIDRDFMERRKQMMHLVLEKKALEAIEQLGQDLIEKNKDLHFHLLCLHFLDLICAAKRPEALEFAQTRLVALFGDVPKYVNKVQATIELLTCDFEDPELSSDLHLSSNRLPIN